MVEHNASIQRLLHIEASPRGEESRSTAAAINLITRLGELRPGLRVDRLNLWTETLPEFSGEALAAKYARLSGRDHSPEQARAWRRITTEVERLASADAVLVSTPMWNLGVPYRLKHYIDLITQPGLSFAFEPARGYWPLLEPGPIAVLIASSGDFSSASSYGRPDLATPYLETALRFIGFSHVDCLAIAPTAGSSEAVAEGAERANRRLGVLAERLARAIA